MVHDRPVRIGVNWGHVDQGLLTDLVDQNGRRPDARATKEVPLETIVERTTA